MDRHLELHLRKVAVATWVWVNHTWHVHACTASAANWHLLLPLATTRRGWVMVGAENRGRRSVGADNSLWSKRQCSGSAAISKSAPHEAWAWKRQGERVLLSGKTGSGVSCFACACDTKCTEGTRLLPVFVGIVALRSMPCLTCQPLPRLTVAVMH
jgi:hypothetical protein